MTIKDIAEQVLHDQIDYSYSFMFEHIQTRNDVFPYILFPAKVSTTFYSSLSAESFLDFCMEENSSPILSQKICAPRKPLEPRLQEIPTYHLMSVQKRFWHCRNGRTAKIGLILFSLGILGCVIALITSRVDISLFLLLCWEVPVVIATAIHLYRDRGERETELVKMPYSKDEIELLKNDAEARYRQEVEDYPKLLVKFEDEFNKAVELAKKQREFLEACCVPYLSKTLKNAFSQSEGFMQVSDSPQRGRSEDKLFSALMHTIPDAVHVDTVISGYYPDIMVSTANHVYFDIEIDEPYDAITQKEIHYIGGEDETRNKRITEKNWIVIRFSEKQVMTDCDSCVRVITCLKDLVENGNYDAFIELLRIPDSFIEKRWSKEAARMMAINNYRNSY